VSDLRLEQSARGQFLEYPLGGYVGRHRGPIDDDVGVGWRFVRIGDAGELRQHARPRLGVEAFVIPFFADG